MLPKVIIYNSVSFDGRIRGFKVDKELYYDIAAEWDVDAVLMDSNTLLTGFDTGTGEFQEESEHKVQDLIETNDRPLLVVPDNRGKIRIWTEIIEMPFIRDVLVLCSRSTPQEYLDFLDKRYIKYMIVGYDNVNLGAALEELNLQFDVKSIRVDCGGKVNGELLKDDLVDEICVLMHPVMVGGMSSNSIYTDPDLSSNSTVLDLKLLKMEKLRNEIIFLHYRIMKYKF